MLRFFLLYSHRVDRTDNVRDDGNDDEENAPLQKKNVCIPHYTLHITYLWIGMSTPACALYVSVYVRESLQLRAHM